MDRFSGEQKRTTAIVSLATFQIGFNPGCDLGFGIDQVITYASDARYPGRTQGLSATGRHEIESPVPKPLGGDTIFQVEGGSAGHCGRFSSSRLFLRATAAKELKIAYARLKFRNR